MTKEQPQIDNPIVCTCDYCSTDIYEGDTVWDTDSGTLCINCVAEDMTTRGILDFLGYYPKEASAY